MKQYTWRGQYCRGGWPARCSPFLRSAHVFAWKRIKPRDNVLQARLEDFSRGGGEGEDKKYLLQFLSPHSLPPHYKWNLNMLNGEDSPSWESLYILMFSHYLFLFSIIDSILPFIVCPRSLDPYYIVSCARQVIWSLKGIRLFFFSIDYFHFS